MHERVYVCVCVRTHVNRIFIRAHSQYWRSSNSVNESAPRAFQFVAYRILRSHRQIAANVFRFAQKCAGHSDVGLTGAGLFGADHTGMGTGAGLTGARITGAAGLIGPYFGIVHI